jgi:ABC-type amino acid transport substrate-binding protein
VAALVHKRVRWFVPIGCAKQGGPPVIAGRRFAYEPSFSPPDCSAWHLQRLANADRAPLVFFGDHQYPPLAYLDNGVAAGVDVDIGRALAAVLRKGSICCSPIS